MDLINKDLSSIHRSGWKFPQEVWSKLSDYEKSFILLELDGFKTPSYYKQRLLNLGFSEIGNVLDAACGIGQWSNALAELNNKVVGVDLMSSRTNIADALTIAQGNDCKFETGSIEELPFPNDTFEGVFCYGAFMFTNMPKTLNEFARVLKPGGRLYLNGNSWGWYAHLFFDRGIKQRNYSLVSASLRFFLRTLLSRSSQIIITERLLKKLLKQSGFSLIALDVEGAVNFEKNRKNAPQAAYPAQFYGMKSILEIVAKRV